LGYYAASSGNFLQTFRENLSVPPAGVKMRPIGCPEMSVRNYHYSLRNNSEERSSHLLRRRSLKTRILCDMFSDVKALQAQLNLVQRRIIELF